MRNEILAVFILASICATVKAGRTCEYINGQLICYDDDLEDLATGWIVAIVITSLFFVIGIPVLICFCCACLCFSGRKKSTRGQVHQHPQVVTHQHFVAGQQYPGYPTQPYPATNYGFNVAPPQSLAAAAAVVPPQQAAHVQPSH